MIVGMVWFNPRVFGTAWMKSIGKTQADMQAGQKANMGALYFSAFVNAVVASYVLGLVVMAFGATTWQTGAQVGVLAWLGFLLTAHASRVMWEQKSFAWLAIVAAHDLVALAAIGAFLAVMR
jgi:hypothetical protein